MPEFAYRPRQHYPKKGMLAKATSIHPGRPSVTLVGEFLERNHISTVLLIDGERVGLPYWEWRFYYQVE